MPAGAAERSSNTCILANVCKAGRSDTELIEKTGTPNGNRTRVSAVKGRRPGPLDDGRADSGLIVSLFRPGNPLEPEIFDFFQAFRRRQRQFQSRSGPMSTCTDSVWQ